MSTESQENMNNSPLNKTTDGSGCTEFEIDSSEYQPAMDMMRDILDKPVTNEDEKLLYMMLSSKLNTIEAELKLSFNNAIQKALEQILVVKEEMDEFYDGALFRGDKLHSVKKKTVSDICTAADICSEADTCPLASGLESPLTSACPLQAAHKRSPRNGYKHPWR